MRRIPTKSIVELKWNLKQNKTKLQNSVQKREGVGKKQRTIKWNKEKTNNVHSLLTQPN